MTSAAIRLMLLLALPLLAQKETESVRELLRQDKAPEALQLATRLLTGRSGDGALLAALGDAQFRLGLFETAKTSFVRSLSSDPANARALFGLSRLHRTENNHRSAEALLRRAYAADSNDAEILRAWAGIQESYQDEIAALRLYLLRGIHEDEEKRIDARNRIGYLTATAGRKTATLVSPPDEATIRLTLVDGGPRGEPRGFGIAISINGGKPETLLFDTGASGITIPAKLAAKLGLKPVSMSRLRGLGDDGAKPANLGIAENLRIGSLHFQNVPVTISAKQSPGTSAGLMGTNLFASFVATLDGPKRLLHLNLRRALEQEGESASDATVPRGEEGFFKLRSFDHLLLVETQAGAKTNGWFLIDSGASSNMVSTTLARSTKVYMTPGHMQLMGVSGRVDRPYQARGLDLLFAGLHWPGTEILAIEFQKLNKSVGTEISGLLGFPTLEKLVTTIDYPNGLVRFQKGK